MKLKEFERMLCDALKDIQQGQFPIELMESLHYVNTFERIDIEPSSVGVQNNVPFRCYSLPGFFSCRRRI